MEWDILSIGECMVEFFPDPPGSETYRRSFGGDTLNTIAMAAKFGSRCAYLTRIADDFFGNFLREAITSLGVELTPARFLPAGYNGIYFIAVDHKGERQFQYFRSGSAASTLCAEDVQTQWIAQSHILFSSGITQAISPGAAQAVQHACALANAQNKTVAFDINFRPRLWSITQAAAELQRIIPHLHLLFFSTADIPVVQTAFHTPDEKIPTLLEACWSHGVSIVVIKQGEQGVLLGDHSLRKGIAVRPFISKVVDTSGAGDTFNGAFLHSFRRGKSSIECARWGVAAAALQVSRHGTVSAMPTAQEVEQALEQVEVD